MCGVAAYVAKNPQASHVLMLAEIMQQSLVRGRHAAGFAYVKPGEGIVVKRSIVVEDAIRWLVALKDRPPRALIAHTRYATSGDHLDSRNNQPIVARDFALSFNGVISQAPVEEWPSGLKYTTANDGEIVLRMLERDRASAEALIKSRRVSFAGVVLTRGETVMAARNDKRPLWRSRHLGATFIASTRDILKRAGAHNGAEPIIEVGFFDVA